MTIDSLSGRIVLLTGAAGGFGRALVPAFLARGLRVGLCDVDAEGLAQMEAQYGRDRVLAQACDISDSAAAAACVAGVAEHFGGLHGLINNAALGMGLVRPDHFRRTVQIEDIGTEIWQRFMAVNLSGAFFLTKAAMPIFRRQSFGRIINVTTSFFTMMRPGFAPYGPAKAALEAWSAGLAGELEGTGITVNVVVPGGPADTPMVPAEAGFDRTRLVAPGRMAPPMLWLLSDAGGATTGNRYIAAEWDPDMAPHEAAKTARKAAWPDINTTFMAPE